MIDFNSIYINIKSIVKEVNIMAQIGCITEQGDLGLGFDELNEKDTKAYSEAMNNGSNNNSNKSKDSSC